MSLANVLAIGTCRVHTPLFIAARLGWVNLLQLTPNHYLHTSSEARQMLEYFLGRRMLQKSLHPLVFDSELGTPCYGSPFDVATLTEWMPAASSQSFRALLDTVDHVVMEISTLKVCQFGETFLQENFVNKLVREQTGFHGQAVLNELFRDVPPQRPNAPAYPSLLDRMRAGLQLRYLTDGELMDDISVMHALAPKLVLCSHFVLPAMPARMLGKRQHCRTLIKEACQQLGIPFLDASEALSQLEPDQQTLAPDDWNHFSHTGNIAVGQYYASQLALLGQ
jgi:hypothetical protein